MFETWWYNIGNSLIIQVTLHVHVHVYAKPFLFNTPTFSGHVHMKFSSDFEPRGSFSYKF